MKIKGCLLRFALGLAGVFLSLILVEAGIRLVEAQTGPLFYGGFGNPEYDPRFVQPHPVLDVEHRRNATHRIISKEHASGYFELQTNNRGLREDQDTITPKPPDVFRVLVLGDSQTDGLVNNNESWPHALEQMLNEQRLRSGRRFEVLNAGVITYQPIQEYLWWRVYGKQLEPDLVILGYYLGNDLADAGSDRLGQKTDGTWYLDESPRVQTADSPLRALVRSCRVCVLASYPLRGGPMEDLAKKLGLVNSLVNSDEQSQYLQAHRLCEGCTWQSLHQERIFEKNPGKYKRDLTATEEILKRLKDEVNTSGAQFVLVSIPSRLQAEGDTDGRAASVAQILGVEFNNPPIEEQVAQDIKKISVRIGIPIIETLTGLKGSFEQDRQPLYYSSDWHLNVEGNRVLARSIMGNWDLVPSPEKH